MKKHKYNKNVNKHEQKWLPGSGDGGVVVGRKGIHTGTLSLSLYNALRDGCVCVRNIHAKTLFEQTREKNTFYIEKNIIK